MSTALKPERQAILQTLQTYLMPALCIILPVLFYFVIFQPLIVKTVLEDNVSGTSLLKIPPSAIISDNCSPENDRERRSSPLGRGQVPALVTSRDLAGRYFFSIASAILRLVAISAGRFRVPGDCPSNPAGERVWYHLSWLGMASLEFCCTGMCL